MPTPDGQPGDGHGGGSGQQDFPEQENPLYVGPSIEEIQHVVADHFAPHGLKIVGETELNGSFHVANADRPVSLYLLGYGADVEIRPDDLTDFYNVQVPLEGRSSVVVDGSEVIGAPSTPNIIGPVQNIVMRFRGDLTHRIIRVSRQAVDQAVAEHLGEGDFPALRFESGMNTGDPAVRSWLDLVGRLGAEVASGNLVRSPIAMSHFEQLLVHGLLTTQPHNLSDALLGPSQAAAPSAVRRAMRFCEEKADTPVSMAQIAAAARVSVRTLQESFRVHVGTTPLAYLRRVRLSHAHRDLVAIAERRATGTVTDVALRWGFTHLGRFAQHYQRMYGQPPSRTLRG